ncbi:MAG TPA: hypothetical protein VG267_13155 [Terracidiphilus sp.]|jgi:hypothetical protein|nr:hypothetical protein [Terracidiphilus sp.]
MNLHAEALAKTVKAMRPMLPARDFDLSHRFYVDLGFLPQRLAEGLVEMHLGAFSFILQDYYVEQWANNFVMHVRVSNVQTWWEHISSLDLASRYGARIGAPKQEDWGLVADVIDPSGVLWRFAEISAPELL